jgi:DHA2 family multidrug resistance protein
MSNGSQQPAVNPWIVAVAVMAATFMEVLDSTVVNVSLPHIAGSLSASTEEATWVLTSYLVSNAIVLPITGWLASYFGRKNLLISCIIIFTLSSFLCGIAPSLPILILARVFQGIGGGALQPISQAVLLESFPPEKRGNAMAIWGMGVVVAPIIGPTLGGWITDSYSWRWVFYINLPVGIFAIAMALSFIHDPDYIRPDKNKPIDYIGFALLAFWISCLQIVFDKGQQEDWLASNFITTLLCCSAIGFVSFLVWELRSKFPIVDLSIFKNRNYSVGMGLMMLVGIVLYGCTALLPLFLQTVMDYSAVQSGLTVSPRGFGSITAMLIVGRLIGKFDSRFLILVGFSILGFSMTELAHVNLDIAQWDITTPNILNGLGTAFVFVPLTTVTMGTLRSEQIGNATGMFSLARNLGGGIGIAMMTTMLSRNSQSAQTVLAAHVSPSNPIFMDRLHTLQHALTPALGSHTANAAAYGILSNLVSRQAQLISYVTDFRILAVICLMAIPPVFFLKRVQAKRAEPLAH